MDWLLFVVAAIFLAVCIYGGFVLLRRRRETLEQMQREAAASERIIDLPKQTAADGEVIAGDLPPPTPLHRRRGVAGFLVVLIGLLTTVLLLGGGLLLYERLTSRAPDRFVVLVAPFADGGDGSTGRSVAAELAQVLNQANDTVTAIPINEEPADSAAGLARVQAEGADLLIYGSVAPGALLDSATLQPLLIYQPSGAHGPNAWAGYTTRFAMPRSFVVADAPINGRAVLPRLIATLAAYSAGNADHAFDQFGLLIDDYPELNAQLPRALRGNVLWARGLETDAAAEYRLAIEAPGGEPARLMNNLGAILLDAGDPAARSAFAEAVRLLQNSDLGALRVNLALLAQREQRAVDALVELEQARNLLGPSTPLAVALADAYRDVGRLADAAASIAEAEAQLDRSGAQTPADLRPMYRLQQQAAVAEQQTLLGLAQELDAQGPIVWELEIAPLLPIRTITGLRDDMRAAAERSNLALTRWRQRSASDAAGFAGVGLVAAGQVERAEQQLLRQRYYEALLDIEVERTRGIRGRSAVNRTFDALFGGAAPLSESLTILRQLNAISPDSQPLLVALGRAQRAADALDDAEANFTRAVALAPQQPEGYFGLGMVALDRNNPVLAQDRFAAALAANPNFFPARIHDALLAQGRGDWATAAEQYQALYAQRPGPRSAVALGQSLRLSGPEGFTAAEQVLLPYSTTNVAATIELARLYHDAGQEDAAINTYRAALGVDRRSSTAAFELGERLEAREDYEGAREAYRDALRFDENNIDARLALAALYQGPLNQPREARRQYGIALDQGVRTTAQLVTIGDSLMASGNPTQAIRAYENAMSQLDVDISVGYKLAAAYLATDRLAAAAETAQRTLNAVAGDPARSELYRDTLIQLGTIAQRQDNPAAAAGYFAQANQLSPQHVPALLGLGQVAAAEGNWAVASGYFEQAVSQPAGAADPAAQLWHGEALLRIGDLPRAANAYTTALQLKPDYPEALLGLAQVRHAQGDREGALATVEQALAIRSSYAEAHLFKGKVLQELARYDAALAAYDASINANGNLAESRYWRGVLHIRNNNFDDAVRDLSRAVQIQPIFPEAHYWLGRAYFAQGQAEQAQNAFRRAIEQNNQFVEALFYSGQAAEDLGNRIDAISAYQTVIQLDGEGEWGQRARVQLNRLG
jgi:tetratricopeptide (TPR) repeat protein